MPARVDLTVVADPDTALARSAQERWSIGRVVSSWRDVAAAEDVDIAVVGLPNQDHRAAVEALISSGKHVLCEKPLAPNAADAQSILDSARLGDATCGTGFNLRRTPTIAAIKRAVTNGVIGMPRQFSTRFFTDYAANKEVPFTWRYQRSLAGSGALGDIGSHVIDLARFLIGDISVISGATLATFIHERPLPAVHVTGHEIGATTGEFGKVDTDDAGVFTCRFASGAIGDIRFNRVAAGYYGPAFHLIGSEGAISFDMTRPGQFELFSGPRSEVVSVPPAHGVSHNYADSYIAQARDFVQAVVEHRPFEPSFEDGLAVAAICDAAQRAAESGQAVVPLHLGRS
jgi:predicted dehydrogenase